jgi:hypothetical protein
MWSTMPRKSLNIEKRTKNWLTEIILDQNDLSSRIDICNHEEQTAEIIEIK